MGVELPTMTQQQLKQSFKFKWTNSHVRYLGTNIPCNLCNIFEFNFAPLLRTLKLDLFRWDKETTWFGRSSILKINVMMRFIYLFQTLAIKLPQSYLS